MKYKGQEFVCKNEFDVRALYNNNKKKMWMIIKKGRTALWCRQIKINDLVFYNTIYSVLTHDTYSFYKYIS